MDNDDLLIAIKDMFEKKVDDISAKVEKQDVEITVIKGGKKTKAK